jgi:hypothetical protein
MFLAHDVFIQVIDITISQIWVTYIVVQKLEAAVTAQSIGNGQLMVQNVGKLEYE